jgi:hypothetical protein
MADNSKPGGSIDRAARRLYTTIDRKVQKT